MAIERSSTIIWHADFRPELTSPKRVRAALNNVLVATGQTRSIALYELTYGIHSLGVLLGGIAILSSCRKYVAYPASQGASLAVDIRKLVTESDPEWKRAPAWADAIREFDRHKGHL